MRLPRARSLRARLLWLVTLAVLPALGMILYDGFQDRRAAGDHARRDALDRARGAARDQQRMAVETGQLLSLLARLPQVRGDARQCDAFLRELLAAGSPYANLGVADADGRMRCAALPFPPGLSLADRPYFRRVMETRAFSSGDYQIGRITGVASINYAHPIIGPGGEVEGLVFAALPLSWLQDRIEVAELPPGSAVTVLDSSLTVLARYPDGPRWVGRRIAGTPMGDVLRAATVDTTGVAPGADGVRRLYGIVPLRDRPGGSGAFLAVGIPTRVAYAAASRGLARNLAALTLLTLLVLGAAWRASDLFVLRQVRGLLRATRRLGAGELAARARVSRGGGEIAELAQAFNEMAGALDQRQREAAENLERIARLNRVYAVLSGVNSALLRVRDSDTLLTELTRIAVEEGQFRRAVVHRVDPATGVPGVVAASGPPGDGADPARPDGPGLAELVLRHGQHVVRNEPSARHPENGSAAAFPLRVGDEVAGVISFYAVEPGFFDEQEVRLLGEMAADASLGLELMEKERRLQYFANFDPLTDLPNRALFDDRLGQALARARQECQQVGVLSVRVDQFAEVNAALGRSVSDPLLRTVAAYLEGAAREGDTVARLATDEFGVVLAGVPEVAEVESLASEIVGHAPHSVTIEDHELFLSLSVGAAVFPHDAEDVAALVRSASLARQAGPASTANTVSFFSAEMNARVQERRTIERELRHAIERDELALHYQPVVDVVTRRVVGVEALVRWSSALLGDLSPARFIPVAEETGLITEIGEWILRTALAQGKRWRTLGHGDIRINVNVSVDQLRQPGFVDRMSEILDETGCDPHSLALGIEITESELMENLDEAVAAVLRFREMGMKVYIDDFGTGYSSLSYLRELPIDTLKIDASFIRDIPGNEDAVAVVKGILAMAKGLELRVIAEGVETEEQFALLRDHGCDAIQGYLFSRPRPAEEIEQLFGVPLEVSTSGTPPPR